MEVAVILPDELAAGFRLIGVKVFNQPDELKEAPYLIISMASYYKELRKRFPSSVIILLDDSSEFTEIREMIKMTLGRDLEVV